MHLISDRDEFIKSVQYIGFSEHSLLEFVLSGFGWKQDSTVNIEPYFQLKPTEVGVIFIGPNSVSWALVLVSVNHVTQAVVRVGSKIGS